MLTYADAQSGRGAAAAPRSAASAAASAASAASAARMDRDVAKEVARRIQALSRERERVGFLNVTFTSTDLKGLAKLVERLLRNKGFTVDAQLRSLLHSVC